MQDDDSICVLLNKSLIFVVGTSSGDIRQSGALLMIWFTKLRQRDSGMMKDIGRAIKIMDIQSENASDFAEKHFNSRSLSSAIRVEWMTMNSVVR
jgi:hypothetical protein